MTAQERHRLNCRLLTNAVNSIEDKTGKMFHEAYPDLNDRYEKYCNGEHTSKYTYIVNQLQILIDSLNA